MLHEGPGVRRGRDRFSDDFLALELSDEVWKDLVNYGKKRKAEHEPLKRRELFVLQTLSKTRQFCSSSRNTRRSLLVRT